ncbi:hypothetical protein [Proteus terrae]|uniref:hypothetical protein n=1 Tax=Proteus terrae TaxID=1574161 RepID=UPI00211DCD1A
MPIIEFSSVITNDASSPLQMQCASRQFTLIIDEPVAYGGKTVVLIQLKRYSPQLAPVKELLLRVLHGFTVLTLKISVLR